jgi:hypothetical protein
MASDASTPLMRQYNSIKQQVPKALLMFRLGDFYELFYDDAVVAARELEITLTARNKEKGAAIPMCGVPYHSAEGYIARLIQKGYRVAICDQMEDPRVAKKLVKREITRIVTPGTATDAHLLRSHENNYLAAVSLLERLQPAPGAGGQPVPDTLGSVDVNPLVTLLPHAERRFPDEPRWALVRAMLEERQTWPERRDDGTLSVAPNLASRLTSRFRDAAAKEPTRQEAQLRWGYFELRRGRVDDALSHFELAGTPDDVVLRYWLHLFKGRALDDIVSELRTKIGK